MSWWKKTLKNIWKPQVFRDLEKEGRLHAGTVSLGSPLSLIGGVFKSAPKILKRALKVTKYVAPKALKVTKAFIPKTITGKIFGASAGLIGYGVLKTSPSARQTVIDMPGKAIDLGEDIGMSIEDDESKHFGKDKVIDAAKDVGMAGLLIGGIYYTAKELKEHFKKKKEEKPITPPGTPDFTTSPELPPEKAPEDQLIKEKPVGIDSEVMTPETISLTPKKRKKRAPKKKTPSVRQSVKININNRPVGLRVTNKRYINNGLLT